MTVHIAVIYIANLLCEQYPVLMTTGRVKYSELEILMIGWQMGLLTDEEYILLTTKPGATV